MARIKLKDRLLPQYTRGEEIFNMVSHIVGGALGISALILCIIKSALKSDNIALLCSIAYGSSLIILYTMSSVYHGLIPKTAKKVFQILDHCAIYFLIAGTYTPFTIISIRKENPIIAFILFGIVWGLTALAVTLTAIDLKTFRYFSFICYIVMGWSAIFALKHLYVALGSTGFLLLILGGVFYSLGAIFFIFGKKHKYIHSVFHLLVLVASIFHFFAIFFFVL